MSVFGNRFPKQQTRGITIEHYRTIPCKGVRSLLDHAIWDRSTYVEFVYHVTLVFIVLLGDGLTAMLKVRLNQFTEAYINGRETIVYTDRAGSILDGRKQESGDGFHFRQTNASTFIWFRSIGWLSAALPNVQAPYFIWPLKAIDFFLQINLGPTNRKSF